MGDQQQQAAGTLLEQSPAGGAEPEPSAVPPTTSPTQPSHSNLYVRNLPLSTFCEANLEQLFAQFGMVESCRIAKQPHTQASKGFGFVKMATVDSAAQAIAQLHGSALGQAALEVKPAEADLAERISGQVPGDNLYVRNLPPDWTQQSVVQLFSAYGTVVNCRLLQSTPPNAHSADVPPTRSALVRLATPDQAAEAIKGEAAKQMEDGGAKLQVRYADTAEEKHAKRAQRGFRAAPAAGAGDLPAGFTSFSTQTEVPALADGGSGPPAPLPSYSALPGVLPAGVSPETLQQTLPPNATASIYVKNLPPEADSLFLYQHFAPHGAILSVRVLMDPQTQKCRGVGFVNFASPLAALAAVQALHGQRRGQRERALHVSLQTLGQSLGQTNHNGQRPA